MEKNKNVLISGASFAGLTTAYRMNQMGYTVTIVEIGKHLKKGGTPVDIKDRTVDIVKRMGIFEQIKACRIGPEKWEFKNADDVTEYSMTIPKLPDDEFEIERDVLLNMLYDLIKNDVSFIFNTSIASIQEKEDGVSVRLADGTESDYALLFGCDGIHSAVRKIWFGEESEYVHYMGQYFAIAIVDKLLVEQGSYQLYGEPDKGLALYAYNGKTDIIFTFRAEKEIDYDFRNPGQQKKIIAMQMEGMRWRAAELQMELIHSGSFYFDKFCQVKMTSWTKGWVAMVGDAGYCASPAAGMGGSLAIIGATALADALERNSGNYSLAFEAYNQELRPYIEEIQTIAAENLDKLLPRTEEESSYRNKHGFEF